MGVEAREREAKVEEVVFASVDVEVRKMEEWDARRSCGGGAG